VEEYMKKTKTRLIVRKGDENVALRTDDIAFVYRDNAIVLAVDKDQKKYLCEKNLMELESELDNSLFFRANRKYLVNLNYIKSFKTFEKVKLEVNLVFPSNNHQIIVSQETAPVFKKWIAEEF
jgi:DNA-binding LytR/AlgR family response regulator